MIRGEESGQPQAFNGELFKEQMAAKTCPQNPLNYRLAPEAKRDLEAIWLYALEEWGLEQANRYTDELTDVFARLVVGPQLGTACDHIRTGYHRRRVGRSIIA